MGLPGLDFFSKPKINTQYADQWFAAGKGNKDAMKQYGVWDDPVSRNRMLKKYAAWDAEVSASSKR